MSDTRREIYHCLKACHPSEPDVLIHALSDAVSDFIQQTHENADSPVSRETLLRAKAVLQDMLGDPEPGEDAGCRCKPAPCPEPCTACSADKIDANKLDPAFVAWAKGPNPDPRHRRPEPDQPKLDTGTAFERNPDHVRGHILREAYNIINGERQDRYGAPEDSFALIGDFWSIYLKKAFHRPEDPWRVRSRDVAILMALFKIARFMNRGDRDSLCDCAGYIGIAGSLIQPEPVRGVMGTMPGQGGDK